MKKEKIYRTLLLNPVPNLTAAENDFLLDLVFNAEEPITVSSAHLERKGSLAIYSTGVVVDSLIGLRQHIIDSFGQYTSKVNVDILFLQELLKNPNVDFSETEKSLALESILKGQPMKMSLHQFASFVQRNATPNIIGFEIGLRVKSSEVYLSEMPKMK